MAAGTAAQQKGYHRDRQIISAIEQCNALTTEQIRVMFFGGLKHGLRKAQERLKKLHERKLVKRCRFSPLEPYCYYIGSKPGNLEHTLALNWVYIWFIKGLKSWEQIHCFNTEVVYGELRCDAFVAIKNKVTGKIKLCFVELDRATNPFDKVPKYNHFYQTDGYRKCWWYDVADRFPVVLIVTTTHKRAANIQKRIDAENINGLEFKTVLLDDIKEELQ